MFKTIKEIKEAGKNGLKIVRINMYNRETNKLRLDKFLAELRAKNYQNILVTETESEYQIKCRSSETETLKYWNCWRDSGENPHYKVVEYAKEQNPGALVSNPRMDPDEPNFILVDIYGRLKEYSIHKWDKNPVEFGEVFIRSRDYYFVPEGKTGKEFGQSLNSDNLVVDESGNIEGWDVKNQNGEVFIKYRFSGE